MRRGVRALTTHSLTNTASVARCRSIVAASLSERVGVLSLMVKCGLAKSNGEARRLIQQGGVLIADEKVTDPAATVSKADLEAGVVIKKGKKVFHKAGLAK